MRVMAKKGEKLPPEKMSPEFKANMGRLSKLNTDGTRTLASEAGEKSVEARRETASMKVYLEMIAESPLLPSFEEVHQLWQLPDESKNNKMALAMALFKAAIQGNVKAIELILRIMGEYEETSNINLRQQFGRMVLGQKNGVQG